MNKSFVLSGGRKNDRFESGFKPATLPDWQNGNVNMETRATQHCASIAPRSSLSSCETFRGTFIPISLWRLELGPKGCSMNSG